ncbi:MAG TPA: DegT/DnrJ/EryC1/StrS family aminotransferase [Candidatus Xenobia bacterium]
MRALESVVDSTQFIHGPEVKAFEVEMARLCQTSAAIGVGTGTDALVLALMAMGVGRQDEVITTPWTFFATAEAIAHLGARPVFVDIEADTFNLDPNRIEAAITAKTKAILPVHIFGLPANMDAIMEIARTRGLKVIEDAAQAAGARFKGKAAGGLGDAGCFSFYPTKNLGGMGDGGMVTTQDAALEARIRQIANHGQLPGQKYMYHSIGTNSRLDSLQAAVLRVKLRHLNAWNARRRAIAALYRKLLEGSLVVTPAPHPDYEHVHHLYTVRAPRRDALVEHLKAHAVGCMVYYPLSLHLQDALKFLGYREGDLPVAEKAQQEVISLPMFPELTDAQVHRTVEVILDFYR